MLYLFIYAKQEPAFASSRHAVVAVLSLIGSMCIKAREKVANFPIWCGDSTLPVGYYHASEKHSANLGKLDDILLALTQCQISCAGLCVCQHGHQPLPAGRRTGGVVSGKEPIAIRHMNIPPLVQVLITGL